MSDQGTITPFPAPAPGVVDPLAVALGYKAWNYNSAATGTGSPIATGFAYATALYIPPGTVVNNVDAIVDTAGSGVIPTYFAVGLASPAVVVAQSANLAASALLTSLGAKEFPLAAPYVTNPADSPLGLYYALICEVGAFATTAVQFRRGNATTPGYAIGARVLFGNIGNGLANLPANGAAVALTTVGGFGFFVGVS